jgi:hypothetical protein
MKPNTSNNNEHKCKECEDEGVLWILSPCPCCKKGRYVKKLGNKYRKPIK